MNPYYERRRSLPYYAAIRGWLQALAPADSILDVGPADTPIVQWGSFRRRCTIDPAERPPLRGVTAHRGAFPQDLPADWPERYDVVLCLQVLEHLADPAACAAELLRRGRRVCLSVPYRWPAGACPEHRWDPIDESTLRQWTGREPVESLISGTEAARLIAWYREP